MSSSLMDGGLLNVLAIHIDVARLAANHAATGGHPDPCRSWTLVMQMIARLVLLGKDLVYNYSKVHGGRTSF